MGTCPVATCCFVLIFFPILPFLGGGGVGGTGEGGYPALREWY